MEKEELLLIHGTEYKEMTKEILYAAGLEAQIGARDKKIGIKPNLVAPSEAFLGATTHPEIVAGIIEYLQEGSKPPGAAADSKRSCLSPISLSDTYLRIQFFQNAFFF